MPMPHPAVQHPVRTPRATGPLDPLGPVAFLVAALLVLAPLLTPAPTRAQGDPARPTDPKAREAAEALPTLRDLGAEEASSGVRVSLDGTRPLISETPRPTFSGTADALEGATVTVLLERVNDEASDEGADDGGGQGDQEAAPPPTMLLAETTVGRDGTWRLEWPRDLAPGTWQVTVALERDGAVRALLVVQPEGRLPLAPLTAGPVETVAPEEPTGPEFRAFTDRWRIVPPAGPLTVERPEGAWWDPYGQNVLKGDRPIWGEDVFLSLGAIVDLLGEYGGVPVPAGISTDEPASVAFFGEDGLALGVANLALSADLYKGRTAFRPIDWRVRATVALNGNFASVSENAVVKPDVREGTDRTDGHGALQELFVETKLADLSPNYDFLSLRAGIQPFSSDFRGFVFSDTNLGVRLFGNARSNRWQYNLAFFERLEKDTNSGLNSLEWRDQQVAVANFYRQDFPVLGLISSASLHWVRDEPTFHFDENGFLARPDPAGSATPHEVEAVYVGGALFGHVDRINVDAAAYAVFGEDSLNPIAGPDRTGGGEDAIDIEAYMAALELSIDKDWYRPKLGFFWASGDSDPTDRTGRGFDAIFDNPAFAGGGFSFWNRLGIRLGGTAVTLVNRGSLLPDLKSTKEEGQPNFVNPGLLLVTAGMDIEVTPELRAVVTANHLRFDTTETLELLLFQSPIDEEIGWDLSVGGRWRPFLTENFVVLAGVATFLPGDGFVDIYEDDGALFMGFTNLTLTY